MLGLKIPKRKEADNSRSCTEYVPWENEIEPGIIQTKRNEFMILFSYDGTDVDGFVQEQKDSISDQLEAAISQCDSRVTVWSGAFRRRTEDYPVGRFDDEFSATIDQYWREHLQASGQYTNRHYIAFIISSIQSNGGIFDRVGVQLSAGRSFLGSVAFGLHTKFSENAMQKAFITERATDIQLLRDTAYGVLGGMPYIRAVELQSNALKQALMLILNPASPVQTVRESALDLMLDSSLPDNELDFPYPRLMRFSSTTKQLFCGVLFLKDWPEQTQPGLIDSLLSLPMELTITQTFKLVAQAKASSYIETARAYNQQRLFNFTTVARSKISRSPLSQDDADQGRLHNVNETNAALLAMRSERRVYGYYNITLAIYGESKKIVEDNIRMADEALRSQQFTPGRESVGMLSGWKATLPGMQSEIVRWHFANTGHLADLAFSRTISQGETHCPFYEQQTGLPAPALIVLPTEYATPYHLSPLVGQVGHMMIFGPTGGGKTVLANLVAMMYKRYGEVNIVRFDKNYSAYISTMLTNGDHIDLTSGSVKLCPWKLIKQPRHRVWLAKFTKALIVSHGYEWIATDDEALNVGLDALASLNIEAISLEALQTVIPVRWLAEQLLPWLEGGTYGTLFSSNEDNFQLSANVCIEMGNLIEDPMASPRLIDYFSYLLQDKMALAARPVPTVVDIQEAGFFLQDPIFQRQIDDWLRTFRVRLGSVILSMQSVRTATDSKIFATLGDNVPTRIFLPNVQANTEEWRDLYRTTLGLNDVQIDRIATAVKYRDYYLVRDGVSRMLNFRAPPQVLAGLRTGKRELAIFREVMPATPALRKNWAWKEEYVRRLLADDNQFAREST